MTRATRWLAGEPMIRDEEDQIRREIHVDLIKRLALLRRQARTIETLKAQLALAKSVLDGDHDCLLDT